MKSPSAPRTRAPGGSAAATSPANAETAEPTATHPCVHAREPARRRGRGRRTRPSRRTRSARPPLVGASAVSSAATAVRGGRGRAAVYVSRCHGGTSRRARLAEGTAPVRAGRCASPPRPTKEEKGKSDLHASGRVTCVHKPQGLDDSAPRSQEGGTRPGGEDRGPARENWIAGASAAAAPPARRPRRRFEPRSPTRPTTT